MKCKADSNVWIVILSVFAFTAILVVVVQTEGTTKDKFSFNHIPISSSLSSSSSWTSSNFNRYTTMTLPPPPTPSNGFSPPISKAEEKWRRWMKKLQDAVDEVMSYNRGRRKNQSDEDELRKLETELADARAYIKKANNQNHDDDDPEHYYVPRGSLYRNALAFHRSYFAMEKTFKIFVYEEGEPPIFHTGPCSNIYSIEGFFINFLEKNTRFRTTDPDHAHVFFLPYSVAMILTHLFDPIKRDKAVLERTVVDYLNVVSNKYPYWNRSVGVDHFMLSCHDWGPRSTWYHPILYFKSIRALCNANTSEFFNPKKDLSIPEINFISDKLTRPTLNPLPPSNRTILAFFAGRMHGRIRPLLLNKWKEKDPDLQVYEELPSGISYQSKMMNSRFCICPSGWEVASPRVVEAIYSGCVPVLISQAYVLPFSDVLDWNSFSVSVEVEEIGGLKERLMGISDKEYLRLQRNVVKVQKHFEVNDPPQRYDVFHMILHSVWLRRLNVRVGSSE